MKTFPIAFLIVFLVVGMLSCKAPENLNYLQGTLDTGKVTNYVIPEPRIQRGDLISIIVYSDNPAATELYNQVVFNQGPSTTGSIPGYLVDNNGNIPFQGLGNIHVEGLNKQELAALLDSKLKGTVLQNPYYNIRFLNFKVTMLGELKNPGQYSIPVDKISILEAVALAGDFTDFGKKDNVLIIREHSGSRTMNYINLTSPDLFSSPYFFLQQNDVVVVEAVKRKARVNDQLTVRYVAIITSVISTIALVITVFDNN